MPNSLVKAKEKMVEEGNLEVAGRNFPRPYKFRVSDSEKNSDRISELPDSLLLEILSFLSADDAISTSLLSRRWRNLWKWMDSLDFPSQAGKSKRSLNQFIEKALTLHEGLKIKRFCTRLHYNSNCTSHLDSWVNYTIDRNVEKLVLDLFCVDSGVQPYLLPRRIYSCGSLKELEVNLCSFRVPAYFRLGSLEKLVVSNTVFHGDTLRDLISGCPVLAELVLMNCNQARDLDVVVLNPSLKRLKIVEFFDEVEEGTKIKIFAPNLLHLELQSGDPRPCSILDVTSIISAYLDLRRIPTCLSFNAHNQKNYFQIIENIMVGLHEVKTLRLSSWCVQAKLTPEDTHKCLPTPFQHLNHLKLEVKLGKDELPAIACLLWNSPNLEKLTIKLCNQPSPYKEKVDTTENVNTNLSTWSEASFWDCHQAPFHSLKHNVKKIIVENFKGEEDEIRFLTFLLKNSLVLENLVVLVQAKSFVGSIDAYFDYCNKVRRASKTYVESIRRLMASPRPPHTDIMFCGSQCTSFSSVW